MKYHFALLALFFFGNLTAQHGLKAEYYDGSNFNRKILARIDDKIDFYWNRLPPAEGIDPHECSIRWTGRLMAPETGNYTFSARVDDGIRVWIGGVKIIDDWGLNDNGNFSGEVKMDAGKLYDLKVEYFNALIEGEITLLWDIPKEDESWFSSWFNDAPEVVAPEFLFLPKQNKAVHLPEMPVREKKKTNVSPKSALKPKPKTPASPKPKAPKKKTITVDTIQQYIPTNIHFERAKTDILPESFSDLDILAGFLNKQSHLKVRIEGHTDNVGDIYKNVILSQDRADAVAAYLIDKGIERGRITAKGYGGARPLVKSDGRKYHPENRRVEFIIE